MSLQRHLPLDDHPRLPAAFALVVAVLLLTAPAYVLPNAGGGLLALGPFVKWGLAVLGAVVGAVGLVATPGRRPWLPVLVGTFGGAILLGVVSGAGSAGGWLLLVLAGIAGGLVAFGATARRRVALGATALLALPAVVGVAFRIVGVLGFGGVAAAGVGISLVPLVALALVPFLVGVGCAGDLLVRHAGPT